MHISWNYLDKRKAAVDAIESFDDMAFIIEHSDEEIAEVSGSMSGLRSPGMDGLPHAHDPKAGENHLINAIDESVVTRPSVIGRAGDEGDAIEIDVTFGQFLPCFLWILSHDEHRLKLHHLLGDLAETINGISQHRCPIRVLMRPRELYKCLLMPFCRKKHDDRISKIYV